ncbi:MAG: hypothetical protein LM563_03125 [Thermofilum sp.]|nr:hypothetical protein [Thermofilum sp.]
MLLLGLSLAALAAELAVLFTLQRSGARELLSREVSELVLSTGLFLTFLIFASYYAPPGAIETARENLAEAGDALNLIHRKLVGLSLGTTALGVILSFYLARGSYKLPEILQTYAVNLDRLVGPLSSIASLVGLAAALARHFLLLVELGGKLRPYLEALLPTLLIHKVRRFTAPLIALLFTVSVITPYALSLRLPHVEAPLHFIEAPEKWGFAHFKVYDRSGGVVSAPVLVALKDISGRLYIARVSHEYTVALPAGNYTAAWAAAYFTRFDVPGCCLDPKPYAYCSCPVWPARLHLDNYSVVNVQVSLPVNLIYCEEGVGGIFTAQRGGAPLPFSSVNCRAAVYVEPREGEPAFIAVKGGGYGVIFPSGRVPAGNGTCWYVNVSRTGGKPPGVEIDHDLLGRARRGYIFWWNSVKDAVAEHLRSLFEVRNSNTPNYMEYELMVSFYKGACAGQPVQVPFAEVLIQGVCCWNDSHAVPLNPFWEQTHLIADSLPLLAGDIIRLFSLLYNSALLVVYWASGVLLAAGLYMGTLPYTAKALAERLTRGARLIPLLSLKAGEQQLWKPRRSLRDEIEDALWERSTIKRLARMLYILASHALRGTVSALRSKPVPLALRTFEVASASAARRYQREKAAAPDGWRRRYRLAKLARESSRVAKILYNVSTWPSGEHALRTASIAAGTLGTLARLARVIIPEIYYRARGYKVLLPYSLGYKQLEENFLAPRRSAMTNYERRVAPLVHKYLQELSDEVAKRAPWVAASAEWREFKEALQKAKRLHELDAAAELLLGMGEDVRRLVARITKVAPSPWMERDFALYLRLRALEEFERKGETWATFYKNMFLHELLLPLDWRARLQHKLWKLRRWHKWYLGEPI